MRIYRQAKCMPCSVRTLVLIFCLMAHNAGHITNLHRLLLYVILLAAGFVRLWSAPDRVFADNIRSLQVCLNDNVFLQPVIRLGSSDYITLSFDCMSHVYERYTCRLVHCNAEWKPEDLLESEYMDGFNDRPIRNYQTSVGTMFQYTHYEQIFPNKDVQLLVSGNYMIKIFDSSENLVAQACFYVVEPHVTISAAVTGNTDIEMNGGYQQLSYTVQWGSGTDIRDAASELITSVSQNGRTDNVVYGVKPTYVRGNQIEYSHCRELIFPAGSPFRRFEMTDYYSNTQNVESIGYYEPYYHATLFVDGQTHNYIYDQDQAGHYVVRSLNTENSNYNGDYLLTHFYLKAPYRNDGSFYISGYVTNHEFAERYRMEWDNSLQLYTAVIPLKMGSYNYQYLWVPQGETQGQTHLAEGDFWQTKNSYQIFVYQRSFGARYDRLIGFTEQFSE